MRMSIGARKITLLVANGIVAIRAETIKTHMVNVPPNKK
jgi:hypothetical protein